MSGLRKSKEESITPEQEALGAKLWQRVYQNLRIGLNADEREYLITLGALQKLNMSLRKA